MPSPTTRERSTSHMFAMMERLGIDPRGVAVARLGVGYATAFHRCESCACKSECGEWIGKAPASVTVAPRFCPNADVFFELKFDSLCCNPAFTGNA